MCHGEIGEGGLGPVLLDTSMTIADLTEAIDERMPDGSTDECRGDCASTLATFVREQLTSSALACTEVAPSPRRLRLLTRREYRNTVNDLFGGAQPTPPTCASELQCGFRDDCDSGVCRPNSCTAHTFVFDPQGQSHGSVHVAGDFNGWPGTVAAGGWPMAYDGGTGLWTLQRDLGEGSHLYKFVLDETTWIADARNPDSVDDGFGGQNSVLELSCAGGGGGGGDAGFDFDPAGRLPSESRPPGFFYDNNADAAQITAAYMDSYLDAAGDIAETAEISALVPCDPAVGDANCARSFATTFGARAFRRPLTDDEIARYRDLVTGASTFTDGVRVAVRAFLASPHFLYRSEVGTAQGGGTYRLTDHEVASALSYMFWGTMPDEELLEAAARAELAGTEGIEAQARRLLDDPRSRDTVAAFAAQWLGAENIHTVDKNGGLFPEFDDAMRQAMADETAQLFNHVIFDSTHTYEELVTANYSFVDDQLAQVYGMPAPGTGALTRQDYPDATRAGFLAHGSVMGTTAHSDQTSPIRRGLFIRQRVLCQELPPPPADAATVPQIDPNATTRERFRQHTADPRCSGCHQYIDDLGFGFENFDAIGRYRTSENGMPIDSSANMNDVERLGSSTSAPFASLTELGQTLATSESAKSCFVRQYYRFARGFRETLTERCARLWIEDWFAQSGGDIREMMIAVATSPDFTLRR